MSGRQTMVVRALRGHQAKGVTLYTFFMKGADILKVADISRIERTGPKLKGFQRGEIRKHIAGIAAYLNSGSVLFPNAILLAVSERVQFVQSRGPKPSGLVEVGQIGTLTLPMPTKGPKSAWIVDGQQRSLALSRSKNGDLPVPVVAFVSEDLKEHREQFILVNKARPLSARLVNELLPDVDVYLPPDLASRKMPSALVNQLGQDPKSPFYGLIKRPTLSSKGLVVNDTALIKAIRRQINQPLGALASLRSPDASQGNVADMYAALAEYWRSVKAVFPAAWGRPPQESRLMHSVGIEAMSMLMDHLYARYAGAPNLESTVKRRLSEMAPYCAWTSGRWPDLGRDWNDLEYTNKDVKQLASQLLRLETTAPLRVVA